MRRAILAVVALLFAAHVQAADCVWASITGASRSKTATGAVTCTFTVATAAATDGMWLDSVGSFSVEVCAAAGQTVTTSFALSAYVYGAYSLVWAPAPFWDLPANTGIGAQCQQMGSFTVPGPIGRVAFAPSAGAVSSGNITIRVSAVQVGRYDAQGAL